MPSATPHRLQKAIFTVPGSSLPAASTARIASVSSSGVKQFGHSGGAFDGVSMRGTCATGVIAGPPA